MDSLDGLRNSCPWRTVWVHVWGQTSETMGGIIGRVCGEILEQRKIMCGAIFCCSLGMS